jgi:hypothetical protein
VKITVYRIVTSERFINHVGIALFALYFVCMGLFPWISGRGDWIYVQSIWDRWQTFNAGTLALIASAIAIKVARYREVKQRERKFIAARAFLPHALDELMGYFQASAKLYLEEWREYKLKESFPLSLSPLKTPAKLPESYKETFSRCIEHAEPAVGDYLADLLIDLQVHDARMREAFEPPEVGIVEIVSRPLLRSNLRRLARLYGLAAKLFPFARGAERLDSSNLEWGDYKTAYAILKVDLEEIDDLEEYTKSAINRQ